MMFIIVAFFFFAAVLALAIISVLSMVDHIYPLDMNHLKMDITFLAISLISTIVMTHIIIKNRAEIKGLIFEDD